MADIRYFSVAVVVVVVIVLNVRFDTRDPYFVMSYEMPISFVFSCVFDRVSACFIIISICRR